MSTRHEIPNQASSRAVISEATRRRRLTSGPDHPPLHAVFASYDVATKIPHRDITALFRDLASSLVSELEAERARHSMSELALVAAEEQAISLRRQLAMLVHAHALMAVMSLLDAILVGFGVAYLTSDQPASGWVMLALGVLMQVAVIAAPAIGLERSERS